jgi:hypothetical protein
MIKCFCPICNNIMICIRRYPNKICIDCTNSNKLVDEQGNPVTFGNIDESGGFESYHFLNGVRVVKKEHVCYMNDIKLWADEARFGGIVIQIMPNDTTG